MKHTKLVLALAVAGGMLTTGTVAADEVFQPYHVTAQLGAYNTDSGRDVRDDDVWWSLGVGTYFGRNFSLDLEYDRFTGTWRNYNQEIPGATFDEWGLRNLGLMARYHFRDSGFRPYIAGGMGYLEHRNVTSEEGALSFSAGFGFQGSFSQHWSGRLQAIYRYDTESSTIPNNGSHGDVILSAGLNFDFGGKAPPPPPAEPPPPPPPPPNPDLDGDGVLNEHDKCPDTRPGAVVDLDGCEVEAVIELDGVNFDFDKATLKPEAKVVLNEAAALLEKHERVVVEVAGHTDSMGSEEYNQGLSERRANAVQDYLVSKGVRASRLTAKGYGESMPVASNDTDEGRAENRRVELIVLDR